MVKFELWEASIDKMVLWNSYKTQEEAIKVARKKKELGFVGSIAIYKVTIEEIKF